MSHGRNGDLHSRKPADCDKPTKVSGINQVRPLPQCAPTRRAHSLMLNRLVRPISSPTSRVQPSATHERVSPYREALRQVNWKLIVFCVALWWFIYSAPTE